MGLLSQKVKLKVTYKPNLLKRPKGEAENAIVNTLSKTFSDIFTGYKKTTYVCLQS